MLKKKSKVEFFISNVDLKSILVFVQNNEILNLTFAYIKFKTSNEKLRYLRQLTKVVDTKRRYQKVKLLTNK